MWLPCCWVAALFILNILYWNIFCRILALEKLGAVFNQQSTSLTYTPRKFVISQEANSLIIIETDHNAYTAETTQQRKQQMAEEMVRCSQHFVSLLVRVDQVQLVG